MIANVKLMVYYAVVSATYGLLYLIIPMAAAALTIAFTSLLLIPAFAHEGLRLRQRIRRHRDHHEGRPT